MAFSHQPSSTWLNQEALHSATHELPADGAERLGSGAVLGPDCSSLSEPDAEDSSGEPVGGFSNISRQSSVFS